MQFSLKGSNFAPVLSPVVNSSNRAPDKDYEYIDKIEIEAKSDHLIVSSFNGEVSLLAVMDNMKIHELNYEVDKEGSVTISGRYLLDALSSFPVEEYVTFELKDEDGSKNLLIYSKEDPDQKQTLPCFDFKIDFPEFPDKVAKSVEVNTDIITNSLRKIAFAFGYEQQRENFLYFILNTNTEGVRFISGTGGLFCVLNVIGKNTYQEATDDDLQFLIKNDHAQIIRNTFSSYVEDNFLTIEESDPSGNYQVRITSTVYTMSLVSMKKDVNWPDVNMLFKKDFPYKVVIPVKEWIYAYKGISAVHTKQMQKEQRPLKVNLIVDNENKVLKVIADDVLKSNRKVHIVDFVAPDEDINCESATYSAYLEPIASKSSVEDYVQIEFQGEGSRRPVVVYFNASEQVSEGKKLRTINSATGFEESMSAIFVQTSS